MRPAAFALLLCAHAALAQTQDERTLARHGIDPSRESIARYLRALHPDAEQGARIAQLIAQLSSHDSTTREHAVRELLVFGTTAVVALEREAEHVEPEVRRQVALLLDAADSKRTAEVLYSVFRVVRARGMSGLAVEILNVIPIATDSHVRRAASAALVATARPADLDTLLRTAADGDPVARMACFAALRTVAGKEAIPVLRQAVRSRSDRVRLAAAFELASLGERDALPVFVELLDAPDEWIRFRAGAALRAIGKRSFGYSAGATTERRAPAARRWREWLASEAREATWETPLRWFTSARGRTLVATYTNGKIVEYDDDGEVTWTTTDVKTPWAVRGLPDGHRLVSSYTQNLVYEYDRDGKQIWVSERLPGNVTGLDRLSNGNIIVVMGTGSNQLLEISREKKIVSKLTLTGRPVSVRALENGNLLVALHGAGSVVEVDREGRVRWRVEGLNQPYSAERLPSGNVLVAAYGSQRIVEFDHDGAVVWERRGVQGVYTAERLDDGSLIYANKSSVMRVRPDGNKVWSKSLPGNYLYLDRY